MRRLLLPTALALLSAACGGATTPDPTPAVAPTASAPATSAPAAAPPAETATTAPATTTAQSLEPAGPPAPDFELELSDGSTFVLAGEQKPVYLVFWAEW